MPLTPPHSNLNMPLTPPHSNENVPPDETFPTQTLLEKIIPEERDIDLKHQIMEPTMQPLVENNNVQQVSPEQIQQHSGGYIPLYTHEIPIQHREFEKAQDVKPKKVSRCPGFYPDSEYKIWYK